MRTRSKPASSWTRAVRARTSASNTGPRGAMISDDSCGAAQPMNSGTSAAIPDKSPQLSPFDIHPEHVERGVVQALAALARDRRRRRDVLTDDAHRAADRP